MDDNERTPRGGALALDAGSLLDHHKSSSSSKEDRLPTPAFDQQEAMTSMSSNDDVTSTQSVDEDDQQDVGDDHPKVNYKYVDEGEDHDGKASHRHPLEEEDEDDEEVFAAHAAARAISESDAAAAAAAQQHPQQKTSPTSKHQGSTMNEASTTKTKKAPALPTATPQGTSGSATIPPSSHAHYVAQALQQVPPPQPQSLPHPHSVFQHQAPAPSTPIPMPVTTSAPIVCRICQRGDEDGRPILRFLPVEHDMAAAAASPSVITFTQDICLHIFCGKTASILPSVMKPELEILTKAGLKNKHGIGPEVNAALARTRCAILEQEGAKEKHFYLVREFEAHLAAIRHTRISYAANGGSSDMPVGIMGGQQHQQQQRRPQQQQYYYAPVYPGSTEYHHQQYHHNPQPSSEHEIVPPSSGHQKYPGEDAEDDHSSTSGRSSHHQQQYGQSFDPSAYRFSDGSNMSDSKIIPVHAAASQTHHYKYPLPNVTRNSSNNYAYQHHMASTQLTRDGKVQCACGGTHLPAGTSKGTQSWRAHVTTKRHQKWMEENGMLNAV